MKKTTILFVLMVLAVSAVAISGCTTPTPTVEPTAAPTATPAATPVATSTPAAAAALTINGTVANTTSFTLAELKAMPQSEINTSFTRSTGAVETVNGTGVLLNTLLDMASPASNATNVTFIASDGYSKTANLSDVRASTNATVVIYEDGMLRDAVPGLPSGTWIKNLTTITVS